nr:hypothetical protein [Tanacetum cinerariifolium]
MGCWDKVNGTVPVGWSVLLGFVGEKGILTGNAVARLLGRGEIGDWAEMALGFWGKNDPWTWILDKFELHVKLFLKTLLSDPAFLLIFILALKLPGF